LGLLGLLPGMPHVLLLTASSLAGYAAWRLSKRLPESNGGQGIVEPEAPQHISWSDVSDTVPVTLELGYRLIELVDERKGAPLMARITGIRKQLSRELGFVLPLVKVKDDLALNGNAYRIVIAGVAVGEDAIYPGELLALAAGESPDVIDGRAVKDPTFGLDAIWIDETKRADAIVAGYTVVDAPTVVATHLNNLITANASNLFGLDEGQALIDNLKEHYPQLAQGLVPQPFSLAIVTAVCRALLLERVPLKDFRRIAETLIGLAPRQLDLPALIEAVRQDIGALIVQTIVPSKLPLPVITFDVELERLLAQSVAAGPGAAWPFDPELARRIVTSVNEAVQPLLMAARSFSVITSPACRAALARLLRPHLPETPVLSFLEVPETKAVDVVAIVGGSALLSSNMPDDLVEPSGE
jgi:flagellar biosynthesis protein FlhA